MSGGDGKVLDIFSAPQPQLVKPALRDFHVSRFFLAVPNWTGFASRSAFAWTGVPFEEANLARMPRRECGVYSFVVHSRVAGHTHASYLLYVGKTKRNFRARFAEYLEERADPKGRTYIVEMLTRWDGWLDFCYAPLPVAEVDDAEECLLRALIPPMNEEFPADVRRERKLALK